MLPGERTSTCPHCGQPMATHLLGVRLGPLRARIFDAIQRAGSSGIDADDLFVINDLISDSGWRIVGTRGTGARFHLAARRTKWVSI
jgi:hypothetical protein